MLIKPLINAPSLLQPFLVRKVKIQDCFHVFSSLCIPSVLSGILCSIYSLIADEKEYGVSLYEVFPARSPRSNTSELEEILWLLSRVEPGLGLTAAEQAVNQLLALGTTVFLAVLSGALIGLLVRIPAFDPLERIMDDSCHWQISSIEVLLTGAESNFDLEATDHSLQVPRMKRMRAKVNG